jgi:hypothetical protein
VDVRIDARLHFFLNEGGVKVAGRDSDESNRCHKLPQDGATQKRKAKDLSYVNSTRQQGTVTSETHPRAAHKNPLPFTQGCR